MRFFPWIVIAVFLSAVSADPCQCKGKCPAKNPNDDVYLLAHEDCSMFCSCAHGKPFELPCPPGLHYSPKLRVCAYPREAQCTPGKRNSIISSVDAKDFARGSDNKCIGICPVNDIIKTAVILEHEDCGRFCKCDKGVPHVKECPIGLHFSPALGVCTYPREAQCFRQTVPVITETTEDCCPCFDTTTEAGTTTDGGNSSGAWEATVLTTTEAVTSPSVTTPELTASKPTTLQPTTSEKPTTPEEPTTLKPTTSEKPTTLKPTTSEEPTTQKTTTSEEPTTQKTTTSEEPTTQKTTTSEGPTTSEKPTTLKPTTSEKPTTLKPTTSEEPTTLKPTTPEEPTTLKPTTSEEPTTLKPTTSEEPTTQKTTTSEEPTTPEELTTLKPTTSEKPTTLKPTTSEKPTTLKPTTSEEPTTLKPTTPEKPTTPDPSKLCPADGSKDGEFYPHESSCNKYYICSDSTLYPHTCPDDLLYNPENNACDKAENVNCSSIPISSTTTFTPTAAGDGAGPIDPSKLCPENGSKNGEFYPHESACDKYYICSDSTLHLHQCSDGLSYNPKIYACDNPEKVNCSTTPTPTPPTTPTPARCPDDTSITLIPHETNCSLYYECKNGQKKLKKCPPGLHFNPFLHICEFPNNAGCTTST